MSYGQQLATCIAEAKQQTGVNIQVISDKKFIELCRTGSAEEVEYSITRLKANVHCENKQQVVQLNYALRKEDYPGAGGPYYTHYTTPLLVAITAKRPEIVRLLIRYGANPNEILKSYKAALRDSTAPKRDAVRDLYSSTETLLHIAAKIPNNADIIRALLEGAASPYGIATYDDPYKADMNWNFNRKRSQTLTTACWVSCLLGCCIFSPIILNCCYAKALRVIDKATPLDVARYFGHQENIAILQAATSREPKGRVQNDRYVKLEEFKEDNELSVADPPAGDATPEVGIGSRR